MEFCNNCDNMLYIRQESNEENDTISVEYFCKHCNYIKLVSEDDKSKLISKSSYNQSEMQYDSLMNVNIEYDRSIPHVSHISCINKSTTCTKPKESDNDIMFIKYDKHNMNYLYYCIYCKTFWKQNMNKDNVDDNNGTHCITID